MILSILLHMTILEIVTVGLVVNSEAHVESLLS